MFSPFAFWQPQVASVNTILTATRQADGGKSYFAQNDLHYGKSSGWSATTNNTSPIVDGKSFSSSDNGTAYSTIFCGYNFESYGNKSLSSISVKAKISSITKSGTFKVGIYRYSNSVGDVSSTAGIPVSGINGYYTYGSQIQNAYITSIYSPVSSPLLAEFDLSASTNGDIITFESTTFSDFINNWFKTSNLNEGLVYSNARLSGFLLAVSSTSTPSNSVTFDSVYGIQLQMNAV
jgi:hypothetical protein